MKKKVKRIKIMKPEKRHGILYARVKKENVKSIKAMAKKKGISVSAYVDQVLDQVV